MKFTRPRDSLRNAVRVSLVMDGDTKERLRCLSERTKASQSAIVDWLVENAETDDQGYGSVVARGQADRSINPALDKGQVEGAFVQGTGWLTSEELVWDDTGRLRTHAPSTYKIPLASDRPKVFNVALADWSENREPTVRRSKAVGEPPFMLGISVFEAIGHAVASVAGYRVAPRLDAPATPERVLMAVARLRGAA